MVKPIVHSKKHIPQQSQATIAQAVAHEFNICTSIEGAPSTPVHVSEGASVKAVWLEMWLQNASATVVGSFTAIFYKNPGGANSVTSAELAALHDYDNKKNIFYVTQGLAPINDNTQMLLYKGWLKIPKGKQRMGLGDELNFTIRNNNATAIDQDICGLAVYKSYS